MRWLTEMAVYAKVVEAGGFAPAARQLGLTRSAVSKHVGRLHRLPPEYVPRGRFGNLYALFLPSRQGNPKLRACIDWLLETLERP